MCYFCEEGKDFSIVKKKYGEQWPFENEVVFHDENVFAIVGAAPQVIPYVLILPYRHIYSVTEMTEEEKKSLMSCMDFLLGRGGYSNELCFFEHGGKSESGSSSIDHCHVHIIDGKYGLFEQEHYESFNRYDYIPTIEGSYLMVGKYSKEGIKVKITTDKESHQRQYFRRRLAKIIGEPQWDWRVDYFFERMIKTMNAFQL